MKIAITCRHDGVTESMKAYAREKVEKLRKYFDRAQRAVVTLDKNHDTHLVEIVLDVTRGETLVSRGEAPDVYAACDLAEEKLAAQLRRFKQRLTDHHRGQRGVDGPEAAPEAAPGGVVGVAGGGMAEEPPTYEDVIERMRSDE